MLQRWTISLKYGCADRFAASDFHGIQLWKWWCSYQEYLWHLVMMSKITLISLDLKTNVKSELSILNGLTNKRFCKALEVSEGNVTARIDENKNQGKILTRVCKPISWSRWRYQKFKDPNQSKSSRPDLPWMDFWETFMLMVSRFREMKGIEKLGRRGCWIKNKRHEFRLVHVWDVRIGHLWGGRGDSPLGFRLNLVGSIQALGNACPHKGLNTR